MTTLTATAQPGTASAPASVLLEVTGAPTPPAPVYASNFTTSVDGWAGTPVDGFDDFQGRLLLSTTAGSPNSETASRTVTGLTVGQAYTVRVDSAAEYGSLGVAVQTTGGSTVATAYPTGGDGIRSVTFTATATSHVLVLTVAPVFANTWQGGQQVRSVTVTPVTSWGGTTIYRTDENGIAVVRQDPGGNDTYGGTLTLTDWEPALAGPVTYDVLDGDAGTASATVTVGDYAVWLTAPATATPSTDLPPEFAPAELVTGYDAAGTSRGTVHVIVDRPDPVVNPGPMSTRAGTLDVWARDYAAAEQVRALLDTGETLHLRQPDHAGMDMYFYASAVTVRPVADRWTVSLAYVEVTAP